MGKRKASPYPSSERPALPVFPVELRFLMRPDGGSASVLAPH